MPQSDAHSARFDARALALAITLALTTGLMVAALLVFERDRSLAEGRRLTAAFATVLDEQTTRTIQTLDQRMELVALTIGEQMLSSPLPRPSAHALLERQMQSLSFVRSLQILDVEGRVQLSVGEGTVPGNHQDQDHFRIYQTRPGAGFYLGRPTPGKQPSDWILHAARPMTDPSGRFIGAVVADVQAKYFDDLWQSLALESGSGLSLLSTDGTVMLRSPIADTVIGRNFAGTSLFTQQLPANPTGTYQTTSPFDGSKRLIAYRTLAPYPNLLVSVGRTVDAVLAPWWQLVELVVGGWLLASALLIALAVYVGRVTAQRKSAETRTMAMAQSLSVASEAAGFVLWDWDLATDRWTATPTHYTTLGYPVGDGPIHLDQWITLVHPDDAPIALAARDGLRGASAAQARYNYEVRMRHADGDYRWVHVTGQVMQRDAHGRPTRLIGIRVDVTERKRAEHERLQMLERITEGFIALDPAWRLTYVNQQAGQLLGRDPAQLIGRHMWTEFPSSPGEQFQSLCLQSMRDQKPARIEAFYPDLGLWIEDHIYPSPDGVSIYFRDVTQRKSDEIALRQAKDHAESLLDGANVMIVGLNASGQITLFNQAARDLTGYSLTDLAGRNWFEVICPRLRYPQVWAEFERLSGDGPPKQFENPILTRTGQERLIAWQNSVLREGDRVTGTLSFGIDVTARRQAEIDLAESRDQFEQLALHSLQGIALIQRAQLTYVNPVFCAITGRSQAELSSFFSVAEMQKWVHPDDRGASDMRRRRALQGEVVADVTEMRILHGNGEWRWIQSQTRTLTLSGEPALLVMVIDIHDRKTAEDALRDSEERFRSAFESSAMGISLSDLQGHWLKVNPALCRIAGYSEQELLQMRYEDVTHPDDVAADRELTQELFAGQRASFQLEKRYLHKDGHVVWISLTVALVRDAHGTPTHTVAHIEDIGWRKQLELDLSASQARQRATLDALPDLMFEVDLQGRYHDYHSPRTDLLVLPPQALIGRTVSETMPADAADTVLEGLREAAARGYSDGYQIALTLPDGPHWFELSMARKMALEDDEGPRFIVLSRDISDRVRTQNALRDSEELMRQMAESVSQVFWLADLRANRYLYISPAVEVVLGCSATQMYAEPQCWHRNIHPQDRAWATEALWQAHDTGRYDMQVRLVHPDGSLRWVHARGYPIADFDQTTYRCAGVMEDITARKTLEIREEQERELLHYLASDRPLPDMLERFVLGYEAMVPGMMGSVLLLDADGVHLRHGAAPHLPPDYCTAIDGGAIGPAAGSCGTAAFTGETVVAADIASDPRWVDYRALAQSHGLRACWSVPIRGLQGQMLGAFAFYFDHVRPPSANELAIIERGAQQASQAIERHQAVQALQESEERYRTLVEWSPEAIGVHLDGVMVYCNPAGVALMGARSADELLGKPARDFVHPDDWPEALRNIQASLASNAPGPLSERRMVRLDGSVIDVESKIGPTPLPGGVGVQIVMHDISARKKAETALRESRQQLRILSAKVLAAQETERRRVAHELHDELGQSLTAIKINLQADARLTPGSQGGLMTENIRIVESALQHVRSLALALRPSMLDDLGLASALRWLTEQTTARNALQVNLAFAPLPERLEPDLETAVFRIVQEALTNIVRHAHAREVQVTVEREEPDGLLVQIRDDGDGFDVEAMRRRATEGNSIGVLGMQERATLVGGQLDITSAPGAGCTVTLHCPFRTVSRV